ncbi:MAG: hypothetical protein AB7L09_21310 [Nitrospira sp.]
MDEHESVADVAGDGADVLNKPKREKRFPVMEIFGPTIQGEGNVLGMRTMFIRFGGCDYRCTKCDSLHAVLPELVSAGAQWLTTQDILENLAEIEDTSEVPPMVTLSGGNPCMHKLDDLVDRLNEHDVAIAVETQGTIWQDWLLKCDFVTISPKGPGMGEKFEPARFSQFLARLSEYEENLGRGAIHWCVKIVVQDQRDIEFVKDILSAWPSILDRPGKMYLSLGNPMPPVPVLLGERQLAAAFVSELKNLPPCENLDDFRANLLHNYAILVSEILKEPLLRNCIVTPQFHVLLWGNKQGV